MDNKWRTYLIQLGFGVFPRVKRLKEKVKKIWTRVNGATTENL